MFGLKYLVHISVVFLVLALVLSGCSGTSGNPVHASLSPLPNTWSTIFHVPEGKRLEILYVGAYAYQRSDNPSNPGPVPVDVKVKVTLGGQEIAHIIGGLVNYGYHTQGNPGYDYALGNVVRLYADPNTDVLIEVHGDVSGKQVTITGKLFEANN
jgi:hypothetical protein